MRAGTPDSSQLGEHFFHGGFGGEAVLFAEDGGGAVLDEGVRPADADDGGGDAGGASSTAWPSTSVLPGLRRMRSPALRPDKAG